MRLTLPKFIIKFTGSLYLHKWPFWIVYKPNHHKVKGHEVRNIMDKLKKGDVLLRRYDGYLNTIFTPGFWGHAGLYIGNNRVIHAVGEGVINEDILDFCRTDSVAALRVKDVSDSDIEKAISIAEKKVGDNVEYDYKFRDKNKKVYCTEMVNECYNGIFYDDYEKKLGNMVLMPDGLLKSKRLELVTSIEHKKRK